MEGICVNFIDNGPLSDSSRDVTVATDFGQNWLVHLCKFDQDQSSNP